MKKLLAIASATILLVLVVFTIVSCIKPVTDFGNPTAEILPVPCDFTLRMNEIQCLRKGVDPFDVWHADVKLPPYYPNNRPDLRDEECTEPINAYAPWEYTLMMPLSYLPRKTAWVVYLVFMFVCLGVIVAAGYKMGKSLRGDAWDGALTATLPVVLSFYPIWSNFCIGNLIVPVIAALVAMAWCLNRGHDIAAGVCWSIAMVKPQAAILFAVPLLWRRKFLTCAVAAGLCLLLSVPPALMCKTSVVKLIMETPAANAFLFVGCGTYPSCFCNGAGGSMDIGMGLAIGLICCFAMTLMLRKAADWLLLIMPAAVVSMCWTYVQTYAHSFSYFAFVFLALAIVQAPASRLLWWMGVLLVPFASRVYTCFHRIVTMWPGAFPCFQYSDSTHYLLDTFNSTCSLVVVGLFCLVFWRRPNEAFHSNTLL